MSGAVHTEVSLNDLLRRLSVRLARSVFSLLRRLKSYRVLIVAGSVNTVLYFVYRNNIFSTLTSASTLETPPLRTWSANHRAPSRGRISRTYVNGTFFLSYREARMVSETASGLKYRYLASVKRRDIPL